MFNMFSVIFQDAAIVPKSEYDMYRHKWQLQPQEHRPSLALAALDHCDMYPNTSVLLQLLATTPDTTAEAERFKSYFQRWSDLCQQLFLNGGRTD